MPSKIPVTEVCLISLNAAYNLKDPSTPEGAIWANSVATLKRCSGFRDIYTSTVVEDRTKAHWDCKEDHFAFYDEPHFPEFRKQLLSLCATPPIPIHVVFTPAQPRPLLAPVTEVFMAYFPLPLTPAKKSEWEATWAKFAAAVTKEAAAVGLRDVHGGWVVEDMEVAGKEGMWRAWMGAMGWEGLEAHRAFGESEANGRVGPLLGKGPVHETEVYHVELS